MTQARSTQISLQDTTYYHCISRCVRRAFLCGNDKYSGKSFEHRRLWLVERIRLVNQVFAIDTCAYAVMSNHYHLVLKVDESSAKGWSNEEVVKRWTTLYKAPVLVNRWLVGEKKTVAENKAALAIISLWRERLTDISWFMRNINEYIARQANKEERCKGRFWEGRFKSQALLDEKAVLSCMAYVDLNPLRAGMVNTVEDSKFTSVYERIHSKASEGDVNNEEENANEADGEFKPDINQKYFSKSRLTKQNFLGFLGNYREVCPQAQSNSQLQSNSQYSTQSAVGIEFSLLDYLELLDTLGRVVRPDKTGFIAPCSSNILDVLNMNTDEWKAMSSFFGSRFCCAVGTVVELEHYAKHTERSWVSGKRAMNC
jgi:REP element-mobilizing transposase RayT